MGVHAIVVASI